MLRIYPIVLEVLKQLQPALRRIEVQDRDLARQLRRASASIALNLGEGMYSRGQNRHARYHSALGSARETLSCLEVAALSSYVEEDKQLWDQLDRIVGTLVLLAPTLRGRADRRFRGAQYPAFSFSVSGQGKVNSERHRPRPLVRPRAVCGHARGGLQQRRLTRCHDLSLALCEA
jgi:four helix bundle protein